MKKHILYIFLFVFFCPPVLAETPPELNDEACRLLSLHQPQADVAYKPGLDVSGKPVVEADLNQAKIDVPETMDFELTLDAARFTGLETPDGAEVKTSLGMISLEEDGTLSFNGKTLEGEQEASLRALCAEKGHFIQEKQPNVELQKP